MKTKYLISLFFLTFLATFISGLTLGTYITRYRIANTSTIKTIGVNVFSDENCMIQVTSIDWGILEPNSSTTKTVYVKSNSNVALTLNVYAENWLPPNCTDYVTLTVDPNNVPIQPDEILNVSLTLNIAQNIAGITSFTFDIMFAGSG